MLYNEKLISVLEDLENPKVEIAGGSVVGMVLSIINSLNIYICNLTIGKNKYKDVEDEVIKIKKKNEELRNKTLNIIDEDGQILDKILKTYKTRKEEPKKYEEACKNGVEFCYNVVKLSIETLSLANELEKIGNKMLSSDFKICKKYAFTSVEAGIINVEINLESVNDEKYKENIKNKCKDALNLAEKLK